MENGKVENQSVSQAAYAVANALRNPDESCDIVNQRLFELYQTYSVLKECNKDLPHLTDFLTEVDRDSKMVDDQRISSTNRRFWHNKGKSKYYSIILSLLSLHTLYTLTWSVFSKDNYQSLPA